MIIAIVSAGLSTRSGLRAPVELAKALQDRGHRITFFAPAKGSDRTVATELTGNGVTVKLVSARGIVGEVHKLKQALRKDRPDIIFAHCFFWQLVAARLAGPPLIWTYYGTQLDALKEHHFPDLPLWVRLLNPLGNLFTRVKTQLMVLMADEIVPISQAAAEDLERLYRTKPSATILLGASPTTLTRQTATGSLNPEPYTLKPNILLSVSRLTPYKGFHRLISIVDDIAKDFPNLKLVIAGSSPLPHYHRYLLSIASPNIEFHINVSDAKLLKLYRQADLYVTSDRYLFFGLPIWEAASLGIPTVAMRYKAAPEAVIHGKTGYLAEDENQMKRYLMTLLSDAKLRRHLGNEAKKHAEHHSWSKAAQAYERFFSRTLSKTFAPLFTELLLKVLTSLKTRPPLHLADLGTDEGTNLKILDKLGYLRTFTEVIALDRGKPRLGDLPVRYPQVKSVKADITNMRSLHTNHFDLILCTQVIEHIEDQRSALEEIRRILKPGGTLFLSSVAKHWYGLYWHRNREGKIVVHPDHVHEFDSLTEFSDLLTSSGLKIIEAHAIPGKLPLFDYAVRAFNLLKGKRSAAEHRDIYLTHPRLIRLHRRLSFLPLPGYAIVEAIGQKKMHTRFGRKKLMRRARNEFTRELGQSGAAG